MEIGSIIHWVCVPSQYHEYHWDSYGVVVKIQGKRILFYCFDDLELASAYYVTPEEREDYIGIEIKDGETLEEVTSEELEAVLSENTARIRFLREKIEVQIEENKRQMIYPLEEYLKAISKY